MLKILYLPLIFAFVLLTSSPLKSWAGTQPVLLEIFTSGGGGSCAPATEDEFHNADSNHKDSIEDDHTHDHTHGDESNIAKKDVETVFTELIAENPNIIALNYKHQQQPHLHDEDGNDIITEPVEINENLNEFNQKRSYTYYRNKGFLDQYSNFQMVIGGTYRTIGTMKHIADAAINRYKSEHNPATIRLAINGQNIEIETPKTITEKEIDLTLIGYKKEMESSDQTPLQNIVSSYKELNTWDGAERKETISINEMDADGFVVIAQDRRSGHVHAIGATEKQTSQSQQ